MKKILSYLLILNFVFFSGFSTIQARAEELSTEQENENEEINLDEELIPEQQNEIETTDTDAETEVEPVQQEEPDDDKRDVQQNDKLAIENSTDSKVESNLDELADQNNIYEELEQTEESFIVEEGETNSDIGQEQVPDKNKPIGLKWNPDKPGSFSFNKNNTEGTEIMVYLYKDGVRQLGHSSSSFDFGNFCESDVSINIEESGDYTLRVHVTFNHDDFFNDDKGILSEYSDVFHYIKPEEKISKPIVEWDSESIGLARCIPVEHAEWYELQISKYDHFHTRWVSLSNVNDCNFSDVMEPDTIYKLRARAFSDNINLYAHSDYSDVVEFYFTGSNNGDIHNNENNVQTVIDNSSNDYSDNGEVVQHFWTPTTEEEQLRYSCFGKENVQYTTLNNQPYNINIQNAMQGEKCFEVFKNVADDYTIARTYNIYPLIGTQKYSTDEKVTLSLTIPEALRQENREFKLICVSQNGTPFIFEDQDEDSNTITISTDKFYAYALVYKDMK